MKFVDMRCDWEFVSLCVRTQKGKLEKWLLCRVQSDSSK